MKLITYVNYLKNKSYFPNIHDYGKDWYKMEYCKEQIFHTYF